MKVVIPMAGYGTRLRPHTEECPKPLLPVGGKPMLEHIVERAAESGFRRIVLAVRYLGHMIEEHFGDGGPWGVEIDYLREDSPLGTAGALAMLEPRPEQPFVVTNGDVLTDTSYGDLLDYHNRHQASATMAVRLYEMQNPFGVVQINGIVIEGFEEKPVIQSHINAGIYVISPEAVEVLEVAPRWAPNHRLPSARAVAGRRPAGRPRDGEEEWRSPTALRPRETKGRMINHHREQVLL